MSSRSAPACSDSFFDPFSTTCVDRCVGDSFNISVLTVDDGEIKSRICNKPSSAADGAASETALIVVLLVAVVGVSLAAAAVLLYRRRLHRRRREHGPVSDKQNSVKGDADSETCKSTTSKVCNNNRGTSSTSSSSSNSESNNVPLPPPLPLSTEADSDDAAAVTVAAAKSVSLQSILGQLDLLRPHLTAFKAMLWELEKCLDSGALEHPSALNDCREARDRLKRSVMMLEGQADEALLSDQLQAYKASQLLSWSERCLKRHLVSGKTYAPQSHVTASVARKKPRQQKQQRNNPKQSRKKVQPARRTQSQQVARQQQREGLNRLPSFLQPTSTLNIRRAQSMRDVEMCTEL